MATTRSAARTTWVAIRLALLSTVVLGIAYPLAVTGISQLALPTQANGSLVHQDGTTVGSARIGQSFAGKGADRWFQSRPSAAGVTDDNPGGYDANASAGSNLGPSNPDMTKAVEARRAAIAKADGVQASSVPADAVTASGSGLDPAISPEYAAIQVQRVADARGLSVARVQQLVAEHTSGRQLGFLGEPRVDVLSLNMALAATR